MNNVGCKTLFSGHIPQAQFFAVHKELLPHLNIFLYSLAANEESISSAFGYVCHMLSMIGRYFQIPLRYPAKNKGSRSTISDFVNDKLPEKERE